MKNLFDYATKELSQDAFLCWLFANYNCENKKVSEVSVKLLSRFSIELSANKIINFKIFKQWKYIDILVQFEYENKTHLIAIEDKTFSEEHDQLQKYNEELNEHANSIKSEVVCHKVFYKTAVVNKQENARVDASDKWKIFDIEKIYDFFSAYSQTGSDILDDYITHISDLHKTLYRYKEIPFSEWIGNNYIFERYCDTDVRQKAADIPMRSEIYQGKYVAAYFQKITQSNIVVELAFFFRDRQISAWVKCWEKEKKHNDVNTALRDKIANAIPNDLSVLKHSIRGNRILRAEKPEAFNSFFDFDKWVNDCLNDYRTIIDRLQSI